MILMPLPTLHRTLPLRDNPTTFSRTLRDAIPAQEFSTGRVHLDSRAEEGGKLTDAFDIFADLDLDAAERLVALLQAAIDRARQS